MQLPRNLLLQGALNAEANRDFPLAQQLYAQALSQYPDDPAVNQAWAAFVGRMVELARQLGIHPTGDQGSRSRSPDIVHPAFDLRPDLVLFGFTETKVDEQSRKACDSQFRLLSVAGQKPHEVEGKAPSVKIGEREAILDLRFDSPASLENQWSRQDLDAFLSAPSCIPGPALYASLKAAIHRHIDLMDEGAEVILAVWPLLSFTYSAFPAVPFILLLGPKSTGKTQALTVLEKLCRNGHGSKGTAASMGDLIQSRRATWLIDQANKLPEDMLQDLTDSYKLGSKRTVANEKKRGHPHEFDTYAPKAFAAHKEFDEDLLDRCIQIEMAPAIRTMEPLLASDQRLDHIRHQLYRAVALEGPSLFKSGIFLERKDAGRALHLSDREWELWWPYEVLFDWLQVPVEDREKARAFYRASIPSTKAELPERDRAVLETLKTASAATSGPLAVTADDLNLQRETSDLYIPPSHVGQIIKNHGLAEEKRRVRVSNKKVTQWVINRRKLQTLCERWRLGDEEE
jgi:hypothetical protein